MSDYIHWVNEIVQMISKFENIPNNGYTITGKNTKGEGFFGDILAISIHGANLQIILKLSTQNNKVRRSKPIKESFLNEIYAYTSIFPELSSIEKERNATKRNIVPKCYTTLVRGTQEAVALENLKYKGFRCYPKQQLLDDLHQEFVFKEYAKLHALGFVLREQSPEKFRNISRDLHRGWILLCTGGTFKDNIKSITRQAYENIRPQYERIREKFRKYAEGSVDFLMGIANVWDEAYSTILHGDCWSNNIMFKYKADGAIDQLKFIDWQLVSIGSPVLDLSYFFYSSASRSTLAKLDDYLRIYHEAFSEFVIELGSDPDELYPFEVLKQHWKKYARFGMILGLFLHKVKLTDEDDILDLEDELGGEDGEEKLFADAPLKRQGEYEERVWDLIQHMYEIDAL